jgi:hypothetical protein
MARTRLQAAAEKDCLMGVPEGWCDRSDANDNLCPLPEPKLALYVFWAAGRTSAGQGTLFLSPASAGLFFGAPYWGTS